VLVDCVSKPGFVVGAGLALPWDAASSAPTKDQFDFDLFHRSKYDEVAKSQEKCHCERSEAISPSITN
jgi:hypothetical protein